MKSRIVGQTSINIGENVQTIANIVPVLEVFLEVGESVYTEKGGMAYMVGDVEMSTGARGGVLGSIGRKLTGESVFMTTYTCTGSQAIVAFTSEVPGSILPVSLGPGESLICQKDAFMVAQSSVQLSIHFNKRLGAGLFGGEGFILQKVTGPGVAWMEIAGGVKEMTLRAGQTVKVNPGHIALFEPSVRYNIARVKGVSNILFSGEGLFLATLTGPGRVWLQTMPLANLAAALQLHTAPPQET